MTPHDPSMRALPVPGAGRAPAPNGARPHVSTLVAERLSARRRRVSVIRRRVIAIATAMFLATSGGIFVQLVTGNDPALVEAATVKAAKAEANAASTAAATAKAQAAKAAAPTATTNASTASSSGSTSGSSSANSSSGTASAVTTRAS